MPMRFAASQTVHLTVPEHPVPIEHYLRQPQRLVHALTDPSRVEVLGGDRFRLNLRPLPFLMLSIQPSVDLRVWMGTDGVVYIQSIGYELRGIEFFNDRFSLNLSGHLAPQQNRGKTLLEGRADLQVEVAVPPMLALTPMSLLENTGNRLLKSVLLTIKQRLMHQLIADYQHWLSTERQPVSLSGAYQQQQVVY